MKIGIDIRSCGGEKTGKGWFTFYISRELIKIDHKNEYFLYSQGGIAGFEEFKNVHPVIIDKKGYFWHRAVTKDIVDKRLDIFFAPTSFIIPCLLSFKRPSTKIVIAVHDLVAFLFPESHEAKATILEKLFLRRAIKSASKVVTISENSKKDLIKKFKTPSEKITIVSCAASDDFYPISQTEKSLEKLMDFKEKTLIPNKFFLSVGTIQPRKNYETLVQSFAMIHEKYKEYHLIIVGGRGWGSENLDRIIEDNYLQKHVHLLGYITSKNLNILYNLASAFVFPSLYEGFGIPPLEAMKASCPVIASNISSIPEVLGDAAIYCDPESPAEFAIAMEKLILEPTLRESLINKGRIQCKKFSWASSADKVRSLFAQLR